MKKFLFTALFFGFCCFQIPFAMSADAPDGQALYASACAGCHGKDGGGMGGAPALKGQTPAALAQKLDGYRAGTYGGGRKAVMEGIAKKHSPEELKAVGDYLGTL